MVRLSLLLDFSFAGTNLEQDPDSVFLTRFLLLVGRAATDAQSAFVAAITSISLMLAVALSLAAGRLLAAAASLSIGSAAFATFGVN